LVEHDLAKVGVAGSSPVFRSNNPLANRRRIFFETLVVVPTTIGMVDKIEQCPGGGPDSYRDGRHAPIVIGVACIDRNSSFIVICLVFCINVFALVVELVDTQDLKSCAQQCA
jgi:hypothetical protein